MFWDFFWSSTSIYEIEGFQSGFSFVTVKETGASDVVWTALYEPHLMERDRELAVMDVTKQLAQQGQKYMLRIVQ